MIDDKYKKYEPFFGKWKIDKELGKGAFGRVFEIYWEDDLGSRSTSALKIIHIPSEEALQAQKEAQPDMEAVRNYFLKQVERIKDEIRILQSCKGHSNIVSYEDHMIVENSSETEIGWDILIRMELLYPLNSYFNRPEATQYDVLQMWLDISNALIYCEEKNIIHRDIKPANILISASKKYKLSDFGVARKSIQETDASTRVGTERYMAPEVYKNQRYDKRADYYSLGCVIYYFLNKKRHVFLPPYPQPVDAEDNDRAERKRISGEKIPKIEGVSKEVNDVLRKSMAFRPASRYKSARELHQAIQELLDKQGKELRQRGLNDSAAKIGKRTETTKGLSKATVKSAAQDEKHAKMSTSKLPIAIAGICLVVGIGGIIYGVSVNNGWNQTTERQAAVQHAEEGKSVEAPETAIKEMTEIQRTEPNTKVMTETVTEVQTEAATEAQTEAATEAQTEAATEAQTEAATEAQTEAVTEAQTEAVTEAQTEAVTEAQTQTETETETETMPVPTTPAIGMIERPLDGDEISQEIKMKGWILISAEVGDLDVFADVLSNDEIVQSIPIEPEEMGESTFEKRRERNRMEIAADRGYEIKGSYSVETVPAGTYDLQLRIVDRGTGNEMTLQKIRIEIADQIANNNKDILEFMGVTEETAVSDTHYIFDEKGFAIGIDGEAENITANANQIVMTGWINAETGTSLGMYLDIDSQLYTADSLAENGGEFTITRVPRNLEKMDEELVGNMDGNMEEAGIIVSMKLPFLASGVHSIALSFNVAVPGADTELIDIKPMTVTIDPYAAVNEQNAEQIAQSWESEFPKREAEAQTEPEEQTELWEQ